MARDIQDRVGQILGSEGSKQLIGTAVSELLGGLTSSSNKAQGAAQDQNGNGRALSGTKGLAAGAGAAALAPVALKGIGKLIKGNGIGSLAEAPQKLAEGATSKLGDTVESRVKEKVQEAGGPGGILKDTIKGALPFGGGGGGKAGKQDTEGVGKGRRMPVQQSVDVALPIETVYNQWTQFEEWPKFMHRVTRASQEDPCKVNFSVKIWGKTKEFTADIETQRPDDRIKWKTSQGMNLTGTVAFRELAPNLTRILLSFDVAPGGLVEKYARGVRHVKRAARGDLHRFVAFIEMLEQETGAWRGVIEDGELVEDHDPSYDEQREYADPDELVHGRGSDEDESDDEENDEDEDEQSDQRRQRRSRSGSGGDSGERRSRSSGSQRRSSGSRQGSAQTRRSSASRSTSGSGSTGRSSSRRSSNGRSSSGRSSGGSSSGSSSGRSASGRSSGGSSSGRSSSGRASGRSSTGRSSGGSSSGRSSSGRSSSRSSSGRSGSSGTSRASSRRGSGSSSSSGSSRGSSSGRQRSRSSGRG